MPWGWELSDYGDCEIQVWEDEHCEGRYLGQLRHANTWEKLGSCSGHFRDIHGKEGRPKSAKIVCKAKK
ncbi:uncharacterized protein CLAFUR5_06641 [Fulvia fulva]|uniref:Uncharacterized protein n=1 Tax=Passalora fulva TaxID=5499 RepID=A0A9Q8UQS4_PASFU|nr:uncharacterized protein CLAFUR5_06641 [Fulvia fulva]KAK4621359.1 hypothetical protein CLAFUR4_06500 [Fulvia fulva]UJO18971.1 hypothetical protein CLAFUR5_06641 [Fulvia fulva]